MNHVPISPPGGKRQLTVVRRQCHRVTFTATSGGEGNNGEAGSQPGAVRKPVLQGGLRTLELAYVAGEAEAAGRQMAIWMAFLQSPWPTGIGTWGVHGNCATQVR